MATIVPPPSKRQKTAAAALSREQQEPEIIPEGTIRIRFQNQSMGEVAGTPIAIPFAHASIKNIELLLNSLLGHGEAHERIPYRFFFQGGAQSLGDAADIYTSLITPGV